MTDPVQKNVVPFPAPPETPVIGAPTPDQVVAWLLRVLGEIGRAPATVYRARTALESLSRLPDQIDELITALHHTTEVLERTLPNVEAEITDLGATFRGVDTRIQNLETGVERLTATITNLISAIPGMRRTLRKSDT